MASLSFTLHPQLERDTFFVTDLLLCRALLMNNRLFPWLILVPRVKDAREIIDLAEEDQQQLMREIAQASKVMQSAFPCDKLNVAALGNQVPQLHIHVIARTKNDAAWPNPIWGNASEAYSAKPDNVEKLALTLQSIGK